MILDELWKITGVFVPVLWIGPSAALAEADCATWNTREFFRAATLADVSHCLATSADPEARDENGWTPLHFAAVSGSPEVVQALVALVEAGADLEARDKKGRFPFDLIRENSRLNGTDAYWRLNDGRWK